MEVLREKRQESEQQEKKNEEEVRLIKLTLTIWSRLQALRLVPNFSVARNPPRIDTKCGDHFLQARFPVPTPESHRV